MAAFLYRTDAYQRGEHDRAPDPEPDPEMETAPPLDDLGDGSFASDLCALLPLVAAQLGADAVVAPDQSPWAGSTPEENRCLFSGSRGDVHVKRVSVPADAEMPDLLSVGDGVRRSEAVEISGADSAVIGCGLFTRIDDRRTRYDMPHIHAARARSLLTVSSTVFADQAREGIDTQNEELSFLRPIVEGALPSALE